MRRFQSLGRDSVHSSDSHRVHPVNVLMFQSLGRDSVHSSLLRRGPGPGRTGGFNPSVGILFIQAPIF